jgi:DNA-binding protein
MTLNQREGDTVLVGKKPVMSYVVACLTLFDSGICPVKVKARGLAISRAVDAVELLRRAFVKDLEVCEITIGTQEFVKQSGLDSSVSTIEIVISKPNNRLTPVAKR